MYILKKIICQSAYQYHLTPCPYIGTFCQRVATIRASPSSLFVYSLMPDQVILPPLTHIYVCIDR